MIDFSQINALSIPEGDVVKITDSHGRVLWQKSAIKALKFTSSAAGSKVRFVNTLSEDYTFYYSTDGNNWSQCHGRWSITLNNGDIVYLKGDNPNGLNVSSNPIMAITGSVACEGNIMHLLGENITDIPASGCFRYLFSGCTGLTKAPDLPATTLAASCYNYMFSGCSGLETVPEELPATKAESNCYAHMFENCSKITSSPVIKLSGLSSDCCDYMFRNCSKLNLIEIWATSGQSSSTHMSSWVQNVASSGTFRCKTTNFPSGVGGCPSGWTKVLIS